MATTPLNGIPALVQNFFVRIIHKFFFGHTNCSAVVTNMDKRSVKAKCYIMINVNYLTLNMSASQVATLSIAELLHALHGCIPMVYGFSGISLLISYSYATP